MEFVLLIAFDKNSLGGPAEDAMAALAELTAAFPSLIVQATKGHIWDNCLNLLVFYFIFISEAFIEISRNISSLLTNLKSELRYVDVSFT